MSNGTVGPPAPRLIGVVMVPGVVQRIVDVIGEHVHRPVLVEDPALHVLAYSEHATEVDTVRRNSILERHTTQDVVAWCRAAGVHASRHPVRVRPNRDLDFRPRVCVPVYSHDLLLGFVWFIDDNHSLTDADLNGIDDELASLSAAMYEERLPTQRRATRERAGASLLDDPDGAPDTATRLLRDGVLESDGPTTVIVARVGDPRSADAPQQALERAMATCCGRVGARRALTFSRGDHGVVLLRASIEPHDVATRLHAALADQLDARAAAQVAIGGTGSRLAEAPRAYEEALRAARIATLVPAVGPITSWDRLGSLRALAQLDLDSVDVRTIHPGLAQLLSGPDANAELGATLEAYLDSAGNAAATSATLHLHRTTLYYRLQRIEALAGTDLKDGDERLCLHLGLKLWRLRGAAGQPRASD